MIKHTLDDWLTWINTQHPLTMDLGLDRIRQVGETLDLIKPVVPVVTVGGTNGKGSTVAALESIYEAAGYRTGVLTSPHLFHYRERIRVNKQSFDDHTLIQALKHVDEGCSQSLTLTYFEYTTLAALWLFKQYRCDVFILEVGLGGRLDAVNVVDPSVAIIASIGIEHVNYLGNTREKIAIEKAGIFREHIPAVCGDPDPPQTLMDTANTKQALLSCIGSDYSFEIKDNKWTFVNCDQSLTDLPMPIILLQNAASALMAIQLLKAQLPIEKSAMIKGLRDIQIIARCQLIHGEITHIVDVAHNPDSVLNLANKLRQTPCAGKTIAIVGMLQDKDIETTFANMKDDIDEWYLGDLLDSERGASAEQLAQAANNVGIEVVHAYPDLKAAYQSAYDSAQCDDRFVVFGSFHTVAMLWDHINQQVTQYEH